MFHSVGQARRFPSAHFWTDDSHGVLFLFSLHDFSRLAEYAVADPSAAGIEFWSRVLRSWLDDCGTPGGVAWHPFPTSGRIIAWCAALSAGGWDDKLHADMTRSLGKQMTMLRRSVEHDIGGNHVLRNAAALLIGGLCLSDVRAVERGLGVVRHELPQQILRDGGHEELSPSYHRAVLRDLEDVSVVLSRGGIPSPVELDDAVERMHDWLGAMAGPDGKLPLVNDAWDGPPVDHRAQAAVSDLEASGFLVLRHGGDQAVFDVGPIAPRHLPAHAHADALSFVLWADRSPLVVDPGSFAYAQPERDRFRGTGAHATVAVDGRDQCDFWGVFRAAHLPAVRRLRFDRIDDAIVIAAEHDGYARLGDPVVHRRTFCWLPEDGVVVLDRLTAGRDHQVATQLPLAPGIRPAGGRIGPLRFQALGPGPEPRVETACYSPYFGEGHPIVALSREFTVAPSQVFGWALLREGAETVLEGDAVLVRRRCGGTLRVRAA